MKKGPYIFLTALFVILLFIIGVRYGQKVEQVNKTINYYLSLPPTQPPEKINPLNYETYTLTTCGISFLYPNNLTFTERPNAVYFTDKNNKDMLKIDCLPLNILVDYSAPVATTEVMFKKKKVSADIYKNIKDNNEYYLLYLDNFVKNKQVICYIEKSLFPLFEKTVEFISPKP